MSLSLSPARSAQASWRTYLVPLAVLLAVILLALLFYRNFATAVAILAPILLCMCVLLVAAGLAHWLRLVRHVERRVLNQRAIAHVVEQLAAGLVPRSAAALGASWRELAVVRALATSRGDQTLELIREGLRNAGAGELIAARAATKRSKWERVRAFYDLGWLGDTDQLPVLYRGVADRDDDVAWAAVAALGGMDDTVADQVLLELLEDERFAASRVAEVLDASTHQRPIAVLAERARASSPRSLFWIAYLLGRSGERAALPPLLELVRHPSADVRAAAAEALGRLGDAAAIPALLEMARDDAWFVRLHASRSLGDLQATTSIAVLQAATRDPSWWVRLSALESLRRMATSA